MPTPGLEPLSHGRTGPRGTRHLGGRFAPDSRPPLMPPKIRRQQQRGQECVTGRGECAREHLPGWEMHCRPMRGLVWVWVCMGGGMGPGLQRCGLYGSDRAGWCCWWPARGRVSGQPDVPGGKFSLGLRWTLFACPGSPPCASETGRAYSPALSASPWLLSASLRRVVGRASLLALEFWKVTAERLVD